MHARAAALLLALAAFPAAGAAQSARVEASATVVAPLRTVAPAEVELRIDRDGTAELRVPAKVSGPGGLIVSVTLPATAAGAHSVAASSETDEHRVVLPPRSGATRRASIVYHVATNN